MNILIVCSGNKGLVNPFISEQVDSLVNTGVTADYFLIKGKGFMGYLSNFSRLRRQIRKGGYELIHAHYGLSGLLSVLQRNIPVVTTFHGSDVKKSKVLRLSRLAARFSTHNIVVEKTFKTVLGASGKTTVIPCGVDFDVFFPIEKSEARRLMGLDEQEPLILFTSAFTNPVKNYMLAKAAIELASHRPRLIELKNYSRQQVNLLMNACDILLMTSLTEGSPQVVKEALACHLPVISTPVGDVPELARQFTGISIVPYDAAAIAQTIDIRLDERRRTKPARELLNYDNKEIADRVRAIYSAILKTVD